MPPSRSRRVFLRRLSGLAAATPLVRFDDRWPDTVERALRILPPGTPGEAAEDEDFWAEVQRAFSIDRTIINLNSGGVSPAPRVVQEALARYLAYSNEVPPHTMWVDLEPRLEGVRRQLAETFGCDPEEMAITRNASESLEICQFGLDLEPGDEVLTTSQDYPRMLTTWGQRVRRDGVVLRKVEFPVPAPSHEDLVRRFDEAIGPRTRVLHFCHITNLTGQIFPVRELARLARARGIEAIVDGAHAFAQFPFTRDELDCDYYGTSLHKWLCAPHGTGFLYVRRSKIGGLWPLMAAPEELTGDIRKFEEIGTHPAANHNAIAEALAFHHGIGAERKAARLRYLRDYWMDRLEGLSGVELLTSRDPAMSCGIGTFRVRDVDPGALARHLWDTRRILVTPIGHPEIMGIRVTPNVFTTLPELARFAAAVGETLAAGLPEA